MKYEDAVRVAEKIKPWVPARQREWVAALDTLIAAGRKLSGSPTEPEPKPEPGLADWIMGELGKIRTEMRTAFDGFAEDMIGPDLPSEPDREGLDKIRAREEVLRVLQRTAFVEGYEQRIADTEGPSTPARTERANAAARAKYPDPKPRDPQPGDAVDDHAAACKLPLGTVIKGPGENPAYGMVTTVDTSVHSEVHVDWATRGISARQDRWPATIVVVP